MYTYPYINNIYIYVDTALPSTGSGDDAMSECSFGSRADLDRLLEGPAPAWVQPGQPASVASSRGGPPKSGLVRFVGPVEFANGTWVGMELDLPEGEVIIVGL